MARISTSMCISLLICFERAVAFNYYQTINSVSKYRHNYDYTLGPEFSENQKFAYARVKELSSTPPEIEITLEIYDLESTTLSQRSTTTLTADVGSTSIGLASIKLCRFAILSINETGPKDESRAMLVSWDSFAYPEPNLYLPTNHIVMARGRNFEVFVDDKAICRTSNGMCRIRFENKRNPKRSEFFNGDLVWPSMHIAHANDDFSDRLFIRGFDAAGAYQFLDCDATEPELRGCTRLLVLTNASSTIEAYSLNRGLCFIEKPGNDRSVNCLKFQNKLAVVNRTVTYDKPMSLLEVKESDESEILLIANEHDCVRSDCLNIVISKVPQDSSKPLTHRHQVLRCSPDETLFKASLIRDQFRQALVIEYICESEHEFIFKSVITNDDWFVSAI